MALFTDGSISTLEDLKRYDSAILDLSATERIEISSRLAVAQRELALEISSFLLKRGIPIGPKRDLANVVVTDPLLHAHALSTLAGIYSDASHSQLNDRYENKAKQFAASRQRALHQLFDIGVGITLHPISKAPQPEIFQVEIGTLPPATWSFRIGAFGAGGATGDLSDPLFLHTTANTSPALRLPALPAGSIGWMIYAGDSDTLFRQTALPVDGPAVWVLPSEGLRRDLPDCPVQSADYYVANRRDLLRG